MISLVELSKERFIEFIRRGYICRLALQVPNCMFDFITEDFMNSADLEERINSAISKFEGYREPSYYLFIRDSSDLIKLLKDYNFFNANHQYLKNDESVTIEDLGIIIHNKNYMTDIEKIKVV